MSSKNLLALYGLKWNPFSPELPSEALLATPKIENFAWRVEQLVQEGGFALVTGESGTGKSVALRIVAGRLSALRDVTVGVIERPQSRSPDFYRELGDIFAVKLAPHNRWCGFKALRERWKAHVASSRIRPVLLIDEAQEMGPDVLSELRILSSADFDAMSLLTVILSGDGRLLELLRHQDLVPLGSQNSHAASNRARHARRAAGVAPARAIEGRQRLADDGRADGHAGRSQLGQLPPPDEYGERPPGLRHVAGGRKARREVLPGALPAEGLTSRVQEESEGVKMHTNADHSFPVVRVGDISSEPNTQRWLVDELWGASSVGVIGGAPKCAKTWLGLDMALSVATGTACLGKYAVPQPGPVLVYLAEDALLIVRERIEGTARYRGLELDSVEVHVITVPVLRLDRDGDRARLWETTRRLRPRLLVLDPLVRLHGIDENMPAKWPRCLAYFRSLQRQFDVSVLLVHHTRKNAAGGAAAGIGTSRLQ